jgi:hypothetical protein
MHCASLFDFSLAFLESSCLFSQEGSGGAAADGSLFPRRVSLKESGFCDDPKILSAPELVDGEIFFVNDFSLNSINFACWVVVLPNFDLWQSLSVNHPGGVLVSVLPDSTNYLLAPFISTPSTLVIAGGYCFSAYPGANGSVVMILFSSDPLPSFDEWLPSPKLCFRQICAARESVVVLRSVVSAIDGKVNCHLLHKSAKPFILDLVQKAKNMGIKLNHVPNLARSSKGDFGSFLPSLVLLDEFLVSAQSAFLSKIPSVADPFQRDVHLQLECTSFQRRISDASSAVSDPLFEESVAVNPRSPYNKSVPTENIIAWNDDLIALGLAPLLIFLPNYERSKLLPEARLWCHLRFLDSPILFFLKDDCCTCCWIEDRFFVKTFSPESILADCSGWPLQAIISDVPGIIVALCRLSCYCDWKEEHVDRFVCLGPRLDEVLLQLDVKVTDAQKQLSSIR